MRSVTPITITMAALALAGCGDSDGGSGSLNGELTLTGSSTVAPVATTIAERFEKRHEGVEVNVQAGGSSKGIAHAERGTADIGMSSRALHDSERESLEQHTIARDGVAVIVHSDNAADGFDSSEVRRLFTGDVTNWQALGGADREVTVIHKSAGRATRAVFLDRLDLAADAVEADSIVGSNQQAMQSVAGQPGAVGYVSIGHAQQAIEEGLSLKLTALDGVEATGANVASGDYPVSRPLVLVTQNGEEPPLAEDFLAFAQSSKVSDLIREAGYVPADG